MSMLISIPTPILIAVIAIVIWGISVYFNIKALSVACATIVAIAVIYFLLVEFYVI